MLKSVMHVESILKKSVENYKKKSMLKFSACSENCKRCRAIKMKGMVFRYTWVYSKEDTMAHTHRLVVTS